jgi:hypothetical protein
MDRNTPTAEVMLAVLEGLGERYDGSSPTCWCRASVRTTWTGCATQLLAPEEDGSRVDRQAPAGLRCPRGPGVGPAA